MKKENRSRRQQNKLIVVEVNKPTKEEAKQKIIEINKIINLMYGGK